jgi:hypothetical protein
MKAFLLFIFFLSMQSVQAQSNTVSAGGKAVGTSGSSDYSIGQLVYHTYRNDAFSVAEGVQQPFEIIALATEGPEVIYSNLKIYPNPTFSGFYIAFPTTENGTPTYQLTDASGKVIKHGAVTTIENYIATDDLTSGVYILKINKASNTYRGYKIVKQ